MSKEKIAFDDDDLEGTMESHDDAIVVTLRIGGDQNAVRKCLVATITHEGKQKEQIESALL